MALLVLAACGEDESLEVALAEVNGSGITGTLFVEETPGKSGLGETRFAFTAIDNTAIAAGATPRPMVGFLHEGRCATLGISEHTEGFEADSYARQKYYAVDGHEYHADQVDAYKGSHAFAIHLRVTDFTDDSGAVLACGDL
ncbi:hypothetical protein D7Y13_17345 [Corallococcus praedator]|uniref:Uncharacterized protein n=2 Tax=Myxococcaceae TaxID=31 RepID=A0ABX9QJ92_9BACT|nr:hypothetical protein D7X74_38795 [Corallococcus sp. CA047B]RKH32350.1 hypothetical protein D7X75_16225 [Corallococcus sp. CA031C]RKI07741.1 hypothetical protein D7Y13_17345 [Corallococcus praedator]